MASGQIASFQGVLNIPMYSTPFVFPNFGNTPGFWCSNGEFPIMGFPLAGYQLQQQSGFTGGNCTSGVSSGFFYGMGYANGYSLSIGAGTVGGGGAVFTPPIMYKEQVVFQNIEIGTTPLNPGYTYDNAYSFTQFSGPGNVVVSGNLGCRNTTQGMMVSDNTPVNNAKRFGVNRMCINYFAQVGGFVPYIVNVGSTVGLGGLFEGPSSDLCLQADNNLTGIAASWQLFGGGTFVQQAWIMAAPESTTNYLWTYSSGQLTVASLSINYDIINQTFVGIPDLGLNLLWSTDNATINAQLTAGNVALYPCANGWILTLTNGSADYFISKDGGRYWQLNLFAVNPAILKNGRTQIPNGGNNEFAFSRWIDAAGIVWYGGVATNDNVGNTYPLYSLALNIFYDPVILPAFPPTAFPCWSPCLDRIGGRPGNLNPTALQL